MSFCPWYVLVCSSVPLYCRPVIRWKICRAPHLVSSSSWRAPYHTELLILKNSSSWRAHVAEVLILKSSSSCRAPYLEELLILKSFSSCKAPHLTEVLLLSLICDYMSFCHSIPVVENYRIYKCFSWLLQKEKNESKGLVRPSWNELAHCSFWEMFQKLWRKRWTL